MDYFAFPYKLAKHFRPFETQIDFSRRRALTLDGGDDDRITLTTAQDLANVVARAVEYEGEWPVVGGIKGTELSIGQLIALGEKIRGVSSSLVSLLLLPWTPADGSCWRTRRTLRHREAKGR